MSSARSYCAFTVLVLILSSSWVSGQILDDDPETVWANPQVRLNADQKLVVSAEIGSVNEVRITGSGLVFGGDPSPFSSVEVTEFETVLRSETPVNLQRELELDIKLLRPTVTPPNIDVAFDFAEEVIRPGMASVPSEDFGQFYEDLVQLDLNSDNQFVLTASNVGISGVEFLSESGDLLVGEASLNAWPFDVFVSNDKHNITVGNLGSVVTLDGSIVLNAGWNPEAATQGLTASWGFDGIPVNLEIPKDLFAICDTCPTTTFANPNAAVPEPQGLFLVLAAFATVLPFRRRRPIGR